jgi:hypothetical protein
VLTLHTRRATNRAQTTSRVHQGGTESSSTRPGSLGSARAALRLIKTARRRLLELPALRPRLQPSCDWSPISFDLASGQPAEPLFSYFFNCECPRRGGHRTEANRREHERADRELDCRSASEPASRQCRKRLDGQFSGILFANRVEAVWRRAVAPSSLIPSPIKGQVGPRSNIDIAKSMRLLA